MFLDLRLQESNMGVKLCENTVVELKVLRISDVGAFLDGQTGNTNDDILLHKNQ